MPKYIYIDAPIRYLELLGEGGIDVLERAFEAVSDGELQSFRYLRESLCVAGFLEIDWTTRRWFFSNPGLVECTDGSNETGCWMLLGASFDVGSKLCHDRDINFERQNFTLPQLPNASGRLGVAFPRVLVQSYDAGELTARFADSPVTVVPARAIDEMGRALPEPSLAEGYLAEPTPCRCTNIESDGACPLNRGRSSRLLPSGDWTASAFPHELIAGLYKFDLDGKTLMGTSALLWELSADNLENRFVAELPKNWGLWRNIYSPGKLSFHRARRRMDLYLDRELYDLPLVYRRWLYMLGSRRWPKDSAFDDTLKRYSVVYRDVPQYAAKLIARKLRLLYREID